MARVRALTRSLPSACTIFAWSARRLSVPLWRGAFFLSARICRGEDPRERINQWLDVVICELIVKTFFSRRWWKNFDVLNDSEVRSSHRKHDARILIPLMWFSQLTEKSAKDNIKRNFISELTRSPRLFHVYYFSRFIRPSFNATSIVLAYVFPSLE